MAIGVDKDCTTGRVYWSDISTKQILSSNYDGTDKKVFISEGIYNLINFRGLFEYALIFQWKSL